MTNCELLELAALAAGHDYRPKYGVIVTDEVPGNWNPLVDDGDALRLAVHLGILLRTDFIRLLGDLLCSGVDRHGATRLAIVRIAAEIGQLKKEQQ